MSIGFDEIRLDYSEYPIILDLIKQNYGKNNGCILHPHWQQFSSRDYQSISESNGAFQSLSWMGNGYPNHTEYVQPHIDQYNLMAFFKDHQTVDIQSGLYQFYTIEKLFNKFKNGLPTDNINIIEVGGGYGRLAMFFLAYYGKKCHYINVDFVPTSLLFSEQVMKQMFPNLTIGRFDANKPLEEYNYLSFPAWRIEEIQPNYYDLALNIHSFQEMERKSVDFYKFYFWNTLKNDGMLFTINNPPEYNGWYTGHQYYMMENLFQCVYANKYPIGDDWEKICGVPTLERAFFKDDPSIIDTYCVHCGFIYAMTDGDIESMCPQCKGINIG